MAGQDTRDNVTYLVDYKLEQAYLNVFGKEFVYGDDNNNTPDGSICEYSVYSSKK